MSIFPQTAAMILKEHKHRPITGDVLLIGRQTVLLTVEEAFRLLAEEGIKPRADFLCETDTTTIGSDVAEYITDRSFFSMFCDADVIALDVSDYEGAEIVHDLNTPLPDKYRGVADFIFNGSCLDNLFDPATAIKSISKMLRPRGRVMHLEHGSPIQDAFLCYSPEWFFDFYAVNDYADCQVFVCTFGESLQNPWAAAKWHPFHEADGRLQPSRSSLWIGDFISIVVAEKADASTDDKTPIQSHYRSLYKDGTESFYLKKHMEFESAGRCYAFPVPPPQVVEPPPPRRVPPPLRLFVRPLKRFALSVLARSGFAAQKSEPKLRRDEGADGARSYPEEAAKDQPSQHAANPAIEHLGLLPNRYQAVRSAQVSCEGGEDQFK